MKIRKAFGCWQVAAVMVWMASAFCQSQAALASAADGHLDIYWIDVEGGAATLIVTPQGESVLVDTGNPGRRDPQRIFDVAFSSRSLWWCGNSRRPVANRSRL
jgi:beta-lactamase superfamily II metal-dependent hydrolase